LKTQSRGLSSVLQCLAVCCCMKYYKQTNKYNTISNSFFHCIWNLTEWMRRLALESTAHVLRRQTSAWRSSPVCCVLQYVVLQCFHIVTTRSSIRRFSGACIVVNVFIWPTHRFGIIHSFLLRVCCSLLQPVADYCSLLQSVAVCCCHAFPLPYQGALYCPLGCMYVWVFLLVRVSVCRVRSLLQCVGHWLVWGGYD